MNHLLGDACLATVLKDIFHQTKARQMRLLKTRYRNSLKGDTTVAPKISTGLSEVGGGLVKISLKIISDCFRLQLFPLAFPNERGRNQSPKSTFWAAVPKGTGGVVALGKLSRYDIGNISMISR